ncbi:DgyrCDS1687 [Dimorphilus gyrociliatus]|uniref:DgyrCDS1687 n=1 Tax=Dimorphilus gyrociliatus TaxID=2664684 RepID=A0A7I8V9W8_9ANNE|nr:DgyrCDS1687 [Dimorphilus gyrociliatus]
MKQGILRTDIAMKADSRTLMMNEILSGIQTIKLKKVIETSNTEIPNLVESDKFPQLPRDLHRKNGINNFNFRWKVNANGDKDYLLKAINFSIKREQLIGICGKVGSGKSTLLLNMLGEYSTSNGQISLPSKKSFAPQEPWIYNGTIRENILFGEDFNILKYKKVLHCCCLDKDLETFPLKDQTIVGENGLMLSGGQKSRLSLARSIYRDADIYLLDDPLSALDNRVAKQIMERCIHNYLKYKTVVLVTHQTQFLQDADIVYLIENSTCTEIQKNSLQDFHSENIPNPQMNINVNTNTIESERLNSGASTFKTYTDYLKSGNIVIFLLSLFLFSLVFLMKVLLDKTISILAKEPMNNELLSKVAILLCLMIILEIGKGFLFYINSGLASINLHNKMFAKVMSVAMRFFHINPKGRILNRFSRDMGFIDTELPRMIDFVMAIAGSMMFSICLAIYNVYFLMIPFALAITYVSTTTCAFQYALRQYTLVDGYMTSVERIKEYSLLRSEEDSDKKFPPVSDSWPSNGSLTIKNVFMRYDESLPYSLKNINVNILSGEKIGVVGRTGAGKSSLISALFRMCPVEGEIILDGVNILTDVNLQCSRSVISVIPQDPILFTGTYRSNLDPLDEYCDDDIWMSLKKVYLDKKVGNTAQQLNSTISECGRNLSVGERQLICLARALLKKCHLLIIDEATANVDNETDKCIQNILKCHFKDCTTITIAHRLSTIMDSDKIIVMDSGEVGEYGTVKELLRKEGMFFELVNNQKNIAKDSV